MRAIYVALGKTIELRKFLAFFLSAEVLLNGEKIVESVGGAGHPSSGWGNPAIVLPSLIVVGLTVLR